MLRTAILTAALAAAGMAQPASAQSWGVGVGVEYGPPVFYGPPPVIYYDPRDVPPPTYYGQPPVIFAPGGPPVPQMISPDEMLDRLEAAGYRELSPMAHRGRLYKLNAVDPSGDLVALELSIFTGEIESRRVLAAQRRAPPAVRVAPAPAPVRAVAAAPPPPPAAAPTAAPPAAVPSQDAPSSLRDRLIPPPEEAEDGERDPLVVY